MSVKLTEVATQRFIDNVTSITPGALKGGVQVLARHPLRDDLVQAHGGLIWAESDGYDEVRFPGSTVTVVLPVGTAENKA